MPAPTTTTSGRACIAASLDSQLVFDYAERQRRLAERMEAEGVDVFFLAPSADLEYLTGIERQIPNFGEASYASGWVGGAFFVPGSDPVFVFPRMFAAFDLREEPQGELVIVNETDDGFSAFERVARSGAAGATVAVGDRVWAETVLNLGRILGFERLRTGSLLVNDVRRVKPPDDYREIYELMLAAQEAGRAGAAAGTPAAAVNAACRRPIEEAGLGEHFRHRMGHGIGLDIHERPFISAEEPTPLQPGMTFTDEPSIIIPGRFSVRIEDILVCEEGGGRTLNGYPAALVANG